MIGPFFFSYNSQPPDFPFCSFAFVLMVSEHSSVGPTLMGASTSLAGCFGSVHQKSVASEGPTSLGIPVWVGSAGFGSNLLSFSLRQSGMSCEPIFHLHILIPCTWLTRLYHWYFALFTSLSLESFRNVDDQRSVHLFYALKVCFFRPAQQFLLILSLCVNCDLLKYTVQCRVSRFLYLVFFSLVVKNKIHDWIELESNRFIKNWSKNNLFKSIKIDY